MSLIAVPVYVPFESLQFYYKDRCTTSFFAPYTSPSVASAIAGAPQVSTDFTQSNWTQKLQVILGTLSNTVTASKIDPLSRVKAMTSTSLERPFWEYDSVEKGGSYADFKAAKESGQILLRPMRAVSMRVHDRLIPQGVVIDRYPARNDPKFGFIFGSQVPGVLTTSCPYPLRQGYSVDNTDYLLIEDLRDAPSSNFGMVRWDLYAQSLPASSLATVDLEEVSRYLDTRRDYTVLVNEALDELNSGIYDVLTELGEMPETLKYIFDTLRRIILIFLGMKSKEAAARKRFKGKELIDEISSLWMQFRYAVSPLGYSVNDALKLLDAQATKYQTVRKRRDFPFSYEHRGVKYSGTLEARVFAKMRLNATAKTVGLGLNPLKTLWELTPLSFVVDWVIPIGDMLGALVQPAHSRQIAISGSIRVRAMSIEVDGFPLSNSCDYYRNNVLPNQPTIPYPNVFLNWKRVMDSLALSWGLFLKQHWKS